MNGLAAAAVIRTLFSSFTHPCECAFCAWMCVFVCAFLCCRWMSLRVFFFVHKCLYGKKKREKRCVRICEGKWSLCGEKKKKRKRKGSEDGASRIWFIRASSRIPLHLSPVFFPPRSHLLITFSSPVSLHDHFPFISPLKLETLPSFTSSGLLTPTLHSFLQTRASFPISPPFFSSCLPSSSHPSVYFSL